MRAFIRRAVHVALFTSGMLGAAAGLRSLESTPLWSWANKRVSVGIEQMNDADTVFIGSSRFLRGVQPWVFDEHCRELGVDTRSFNLGLAGFRQYDHDQVIRWVLEKKSDSLRRMVIELHTWRQEGSVGEWFTDKEVESHTWQTAWPRVRTIITDSYSLSAKAVELAYVVSHSLSNVLRVGQGSRIISDYFAGAPSWSPSYPRTDPHRGWEELDEESSGSLRARRQEFLAQGRFYERQIESKHEDVSPARYKGSFDAQYLIEQDRIIRAEGVEPIYVIMPTLSYNHWGRDGVRDVMGRVRLLDMDNPKTNPEIFALQHFFDGSHLNAEGAELVSRALAREVVGSMKQSSSLPQEY